MPEIKIEPVTIGGKTYEVAIATIEKTMLGVEDHGILTFMLDLHYGSGSTFQGAGGYGLDGYDEKTKGRIGTLGAAIIIRKTLEVAGTHEWEKLKGQKVYALRDPGWDGYVRGLMNISDPNKYVIFADCFTGDTKAGR